MANKYIGEIDIKAGKTAFKLIGNFSVAAEMQTAGVDCFDLYESVANNKANLKDVIAFFAACIVMVDNVAPMDKEEAAVDLANALGMNISLTYAMTLLSYIIVGEGAKSEASRMVIKQLLKKAKDSTLWHSLRLPELWGLVLLTSGISACLVISVFMILG